MSFAKQGEQRAIGDKEIPPADMTFLNVLCVLCNLMDRLWSMDCLQQRDGEWGSIAW